jgi:hypothetical protein
MHRIFMAIMDKVYAAISQVNTGVTNSFEIKHVEAKGLMPKKLFVEIIEDNL